MSSKFFCLFLQTVPLFAATVTSSWNGTTDTVWITSTNWSNSAPHNVGDEADFNTSSSLNPNPSITSAVILGTLLFDSAVDHTISLGGGGSLAFQASSGSAAITVDDTNGTGSHAISADFTLTSPLTLTQNSTADFQISGTISGSQALTKTGTGLVDLEGTNSSFSGGVTITQGMLRILDDDALGVASVTTTIADGTLEWIGNGTSSRPYALTGEASVGVIGGDTITFSGIVSGVGSLTTVDAGTLVLTGTNTYQGGTSVNAGILSIASDTNLGNTSGALNLGNGTLLTTSGITSSRSGTISGAATINTNGNTDVLSGNFSGTGSLTVSGSGTLTLTGANSYTGGTTISANTALTGTTNGIQGNITFGAASSSLTFNQSFDGTYSGTLSGAGPLTKTGTGTLTISGTNSSYTGSTTISGGTLSVTGSLSGSSIAISSGGTLSGNGTVGATTSTGGAINPGAGSTLGTLSINGALSLDANSSVTISVSPTSADKIAATGAATLDGPLTVEVTNGFYGFEADYTIVTTSNRSGSFSSVTTSAVGVTPSLSYTATSALLNLVIENPFALLSLSNFNTRAVGNNLDALHAAGQLSADLLSVINTFIGQSTSVIDNALEEMHPAPYSAFTEMQAETGGQLISLFHRLSYLSCCKCPNRFWVEPFGNTLTMKSKGIELGFEGNTGGVAFGYDHAIDNFVLGIGGAWNYSELDWHHHRGHGDLNGFYGGLYADYQYESFYLGASVLAGVDFYNTSRHIDFVTTNRHAKADYQALDIMAQLSTAYFFGSPQAFFYPYANFDYLYLHTHKFSESGADGLNLTVQAHSDGTLRTEMGLGLQVQDRNLAETICISPLVSLGWVNLCPLQRPLITSTFEGATIPFSVKGWDETWNLFNVNFGLSFTYHCFCIGLTYNAEFSPDSETTLFNQHANVRFDYKW